MNLALQYGKLEELDSHVMSYVQKAEDQISVLAGTNRQQKEYIAPIVGYRQPAVIQRPGAFQNREVSPSMVGLFPTPDFPAARTR